jgi:kumamolisin
MGLINRPLRAGAVAVMGLTIAGYTSALTTSTAVAAPSVARPHLVALSGSVSPTTDKITGGYSSPRMSVEVALTPRDRAQLARSIKAIYTRHSSVYHKWLRTGQFDARYAPTTATRNTVRDYLKSEGLRVVKSASPFLVRATGSSRQVSAAFHTTLREYRDPHGVRYFANSSAVSVPAAIASKIYGVIGLTNTVRDQSNLLRAPRVTSSSGMRAATSTTPPACEEPYVGTQELYSALNEGTPILFGYGGGPGCNGLTPSQTNSLYDAPHVGAHGQGAGVTIGVFELSEYQESDVDTWAQQFYGPNYSPPLENVNVDGGPGNPACPAGDECPPSINGFAGDEEVDADIEMQLTISPDVPHLIVYNAPNDETGETELDEYTAIANANQAASVSSSWAVCENDATTALVQAENTVFEQMALQGQSMFGDEGDTGAYSCIRSDGTTIVNVLDPASQPWVTSVGGTSLENFNPGANPSPSYPTGQETVWNVDGLCNSSADEGNVSGFFWCALTGAGGGGNSQYWGRPFYQTGPGVTSSFTQYGNGTTECALAAVGTPCREDPDVSANADEVTPYAEYCTANASTPNSECGFSASQNVPGWFGIGGTSLSSPLWSGIAADRDSFQGFRSGNLNPLLYILYNLDPGLYFHDITGSVAPNNNGVFPTTPGYDEATGIGTPNMAALITASF